MEHMSIKSDGFVSLQPELSCR